MDSGGVALAVCDGSPEFRQFVGLLRMGFQKSGSKLIVLEPDEHIVWAEIEHINPFVIIFCTRFVTKCGLTFMRMLQVRYPVPVITVGFGGENLNSTVKVAGQIGLCQLVINEGKNLQPAVSTILRVAGSSEKVPAEKKRPKVFNKLASVPAPSKKSPPESLSEPKGGYRFSPATVIAIGTSAGGPETLKKLLAGLPESTPGIMIVQHMPESFTGPFAKRLNDNCVLEVLEAEDGMRLFPGRVILANGGMHLELRRDHRGYYAAIFNGPPSCGHRPSVDVLFRSFAKVQPRKSICVMLTGMGSDGAEAMRVFRDAGGRTIVQDEDSSIVFGMPKEAIRAGAAEIILPLDKIPQAILSVAAELKP